MTVNDFIINPKDAKRILIGSDGRLSPIEFAQGLVAILAVWLVIQVLTLLPGIGMLIGVLGFLVYIVLAYSWICIYAKRFHDAGKSGWLAAVMVLVYLVVAILVTFILSPMMGGPSMTMMGTTDTPGGMATMRAGFVLQSILIGLIVNAALGYYMYKLPSKPLD